MIPPSIIWVFSVGSGIGLEDREERVYAALNADMLALKRQLYESGYTRATFVRKEWETRTWPGGYPIFYICHDGGVLCADCANENIAMTSDPEAERDWRVVGSDINYEDDDLQCDNCGKMIESAYGEPHEHT